MSAPFSFIYVAVSVVMIAVGLYLLYQAIRLRSVLRELAQRGEKTTGRVVDSRVHTWENSRGREFTSLIETVEFRTLGGRSIRGRPRFSDAGLTDRTGHSVHIIYLPDDPDTFVAPRDGRQQSGRDVLIRVIAG
ncbi:DUF3592 domain-containing protein, partial [Corynebacterium sp.]|uniref:DUF3592 domain-containing protein n=1 Tax=Corynebacterium sp. TaxID=1720 RepID=UPI0026DEEA52